MSSSQSVSETTDRAAGSAAAVNDAALESLDEELLEQVALALDADA